MWCVVLICVGALRSGGENRLVGAGVIRGVSSVRQLERHGRDGCGDLGSLECRGIVTTRCDVSGCLNAGLCGGSQVRAALLVCGMD